MQIQATILTFHQNQELLKLPIIFQFYDQFLNGFNFDIYIVIVVILFCLFDYDEYIIQWCYLCLLLCCGLSMDMYIINNEQSWLTCMYDKFWNNCECINNKTYWIILYVKRVHDVMTNWIFCKSIALERHWCWSLMWRNTMT